MAVVPGTGSPYDLRITWAEAASVPQMTCNLSGPWSATATATVTFSSNNISFEADMNHDGMPDTYIQSVRPLGSEFRVNTPTTNPQTNPSVGMDYDGNFTIAWQSEGQNLSFFNIIEAQRYDRDGNPIGNEFMVNTADNTSINYSPYVEMSHDGIIAIGWDNTNDPNYYLDGGIGVTVWAKVYGTYNTSGANGQPVVLMDQFGAGGGEHHGDHLRLGRQLRGRLQLPDRQRQPRRLLRRQTSSPRNGSSTTRPATSAAR